MAFILIPELSAGLLVISMICLIDLALFGFMYFWHVSAGYRRISDKASSTISGNTYQKLKRIQLNTHMCKQRLVEPIRPVFTLFRR